MLWAVLLALSAAVTAQAQSQQSPQTTSTRTQAERPQPTNNQTSKSDNGTHSEKQPAHDAMTRQGQDKHPGQQDAPSQNFTAENTHQERLTRYTLWLVIFQGLMAAATIAAAIVVGLYTFYSRRQAQAMQSAVEIARKQLAATDRPWIRVDVTMSQPLVFTKTGANCAFELTFTNVGQSVATRIYSIGSMMLQVGDDPDWKQVDKQQTTLAKMTTLMAQIGEGGGKILFPGEKGSFSEFGAVSTEQIKAAICQLDKSDWPEDYIEASLVGCVIYWAPYSDEPHFTNFAYNIFRHTAKEERYDRGLYLEIGKDIAVADIFLYRMWLGGNNAT